MYTLILGIDAFDPRVFERLSGEGRVPHLTRYADAQRYARFAVTDPAQSEVSWTSIATGQDPGGHGIFDFVHRDPASYGLSVSLLPTRQGLFGVEFTPPFTATTLFDYAAQQGFPATSLWWPATFPARPQSPVRTLPGLGTPDIHGRLGVGTIFSTAEAEPPGTQKTMQARLVRHGKDRYSGQLNGPARKTRQGTKETALDLQLEITGEQRATLQIGRLRQELVEGQWSPIFELTFPLGLMTRVSVLTRAILTQVHPEVHLYFLPLQLHPLRSPWRYGSPNGFVKQLWNGCGPFLTLGWPQDTTGLEEGHLSDEQFLQLCDSIVCTQEKVLMHLLAHFDEGVLAAVFDTLDRVQHMFWRDRPDIVEQWYEKIDALVGRVEQQLARRNSKRAQLLIVSDHGFSDFSYKVHLNRWLLDQGFLNMQQPGEGNNLSAVDWSQSKAYAVGLNSLYLNLAGREGEGCVPAEQAAPLAEQLCQALASWIGPNGKPVVQQVWRREEIFHGPYAAYGPDLVVGYAPGYRGSAQTGLGQWEADAVVANPDHWGGDHCIAAQAVPGVLFANQGLANFPQPSFRDIPPLAVGTTLAPGGFVAPPRPPSQEDQDAVAERLKGLGYL